MHPFFKVIEYSEYLEISIPSQSLAFPKFYTASHLGVLFAPSMSKYPPPENPSLTSAPASLSPKSLK
jgi:hypothetical protein